MKMKWYFRLFSLCIVAAGIFLGTVYAFADEDMARYYAWRAENTTVFYDVSSGVDLTPPYIGLDRVANFYCKSLERNPDDEAVRGSLKSFYEEYRRYLGKADRARITETLGIS